MGVFILNPDLRNLWGVVVMKDTDIITVCAECFMASCWQGIFMCDKARDADITTKTVAELKKLKLEHPSYWEKS